MLRLFVSVNVDRPEVVERIRAVQRELLKFGEGIKLTEPENLHYTLRFIGEVDDGVADEVIKRLGEIRLKQFRISIKGLGYFPGGSRIRVIWAGSEGESLKELATEVNRRLKGLGEDEDFVAHLTIARVKWIKNPEAIISWISENRDIKLGDLDVSTFYLMKSTLLPQGPVYTPLAQFQLL